MWDYPENRESVIATLRRATVVKTDDAGSQQILKQLRGMASERPEDVYRPQSHGFTSHAPSGSEGLFLSLGGRSDRMLALGFEHKDKRPRDLPEGGAALYDADGKIIKLIKEKIEIDAGGKPLTIKNASTVTIEGKTDLAIGLANGRYIRIRANRVDLGIKTAGAEAPFRVGTEGGLSDVVYAVIE